MSANSLNPATPEARIISLLAKNVTVSVIADIVGVTPGYVSQIAADNVERIGAIKYDRLVEETNRDDRINSLEDKAIGVVEGKLKMIEENPFLLKNPMDAVRMLTMVNGLKRRGAKEDNNGVNNNGSNTIVNIVLPMHIVNKYNNAISGNTINSDSVVIDANNNVRVAGEQELVTMPSGTLKLKLEGKDGKQRVKSFTKKISNMFD